MEEKRSSKENTRPKWLDSINITGIFNLHKFLPELLVKLEKTHLALHKDSKISNELVIIKQFVTRLSKLSLDDEEFSGIYLVYLTSIAKKLQELRIYQAKDFVDLGNYLLNMIESYRQKNPTTYLNCKINEENTAFYSSMNSTNLFSTAGPFALSSSPLVNGIVAPFYQDEFKLFNLIPIGFKNKLDTNNKKFSANQLQNSYNTERAIQRYRLHRIGKIHKDHTVNIFESTYTKKAKVTSEANTIYVIGFHGNAYNAPAMLKYLDGQALHYLYKSSDTNKVVMIAPDYPGSAASGGKFSSMDELATDSVVLILKHLIKRGVLPSQIIAMGHSLGGAVLVTGLNQLQKEGIITTAISLNSFSQTQKFVGDSNVIGKMFINNYNNNATEYYQQLPKDRRHVEHTEDDTVIPLEKSLLKSLTANQQEDITEGILMREGNHDLDVHSLEVYIGGVAKSLKIYQEKDDSECFEKICQSVRPFIINQKIVTSNYLVSTDYEIDDRTYLGEIKDKFNSLYDKLSTGNSAKSEIMLGFIHEVVTKIAELTTKDTKERSFFTSRSPLLNALDNLKTNIEKNLLSKENIGALYLSKEFLSQCQQEYVEFTSKMNNSATMHSVV